MSEIFLMEDSPPLRRVLIKQIRDAGYNVTAFEDGQESRNSELMKLADLLITDLAMPVIDGAAVIRNVSDLHPDLPIIVITGDASASLEEIAAVDSVLHKPFVERELINAIESALEKGTCARTDNAF